MKKRINLILYVMNANNFINVIYAQKIIIQNLYAYFAKKIFVNFVHINVNIVDILFVIKRIVYQK